MKRSAMAGPLDSLVGRRGLVEAGKGIVRVKIIAVDPAKKCHKCGGPWGTVEVVEPEMTDDQMMVIPGTKAAGCLNDIDLDEPNAGGQIPPASGGNLDRLVGHSESKGEQE